MHKGKSNPLTVSCECQNLYPFLHRDYCLFITIFSLLASGIVQYDALMIVSPDLLKSVNAEDGKDELTTTDLQGLINTINEYIAGSILSSNSSLFFIELSHVLNIS